MPDEPLTTLEAPVEAPAPAGTGGDRSEAAERVRKLKRRFAAAWGHPKWTRWRKEAAEDMEFMSGVRQWDAETKAKLESKRLPVLTINEIRPVVEIVVGYERSARLDLKPLPEGQEDLENVTILGRLMKRTMGDVEGDFLLSDGFKEGIIGGLAVWYVGVSYAEDPVHGRPDIVLVRPGEVLWDPHAQAYDLRDARDVFWTKMVEVTELQAQYPQHADAIDQALALVELGASPEADLTIPAQDPQDAYRTSLTGLTLYDRDAHEVRIVNAWFRDFVVVHLLVDDTKDTVEEVPDTPAALTLARALVQQDASLKLLSRKRRVIRMSTFLPATNQELESGNPFENDEQTYPFVPFLAYREGEEILGLVRNLKDPQREVNKRRSALAANVSRHGMMRWLSPRNALENPSWLTDAGEEVGWVRGQQAPVEVRPSPMPDWVWQMDAKAKAEIREISGINAPLQGQASSAESGIAIARLQVQGQVITTGLFDNYRRSRRLFGQRLAKRIQQVFTSEMTVRLDTEAGGSEFVQLNRQEVDAQGHMRVVRNIPDLKYDVTISEAPSTPTARSAALAVLFELIGKMPQLGPALADILIELTDIPDREKVLARIRPLIQPQAGSGPPPPGGNGSAQPTPSTGSPGIRSGMVVEGLPPGVGTAMR